MANNYIEFYFDDENIFTAEIHRDGKVRRIKRKDNIEGLLKICERYGFHIEKEGIIDRRVNAISDAYDDFKKKNIRNERLKILGNIVSNMVVSKKNPTIGKTIVAGSLAVVIAATGYGLKNHASNTTAENPISYQTQEMHDEVMEIENLEDKIIDDESIHKNEINSMLQNDSFHFSFEDRTHDLTLSNARRYEDLFEKYATQYGLDKDLLIALAAQESSGEHFGNIGNGPAEGIMQIEKSVNIDSDVYAYNFNTGQVDKMHITSENIKDLETNIKVGAMILRSSIENNHYNIPLALQTYNFGVGNMNKVIAICSELEHVNEQDVRNNVSHNEWLNYRTFLHIGDPKYVEHVFSFLPSNTEITVKDRDGNPRSVRIVNDYQKTTQL